LSKVVVTDCKDAFNLVGSEASSRKAKVLLALGLGASVCSAQTLSHKWEELTSPDFAKAIQKAGGVCMLPMGSMEKFGPSGPIGTNSYLVDALAVEAAKQEYALIFPEYFVAGTNDVANLLGTIAYSEHLQYEMLEETTQEMARNGCKKILLVNGHSGNNSMINQFLANDLNKPHEYDYVVYSVYGSNFKPGPNMPGMTDAMKPSKPGLTVMEARSESPCCWPIGRTWFIWIGRMMSQELSSI
jgi:creatinine amidohydrolase